MPTKISKCLCQNLFIGAAAQIRAVYKDHEILITLKRCITLSFKFLVASQNFYSFMIVVLTKTFFVLFGDSANRTKAFNLKVNYNELTLVFVHHVNTECT